MNSERVALQRRAGPLDAIQEVVHGVDPNSLETARILVAGKFSDDERARESIDRGTEAAEILGKLGMDADTLAAALLLRFLGEGALDRAAIEKSIGAQVARLTQGALRIASLKDLRKTATETLQANRLRQMLLTIAEDPRVVLVSLAHQLCALFAERNKRVTHWTAGHPLDGRSNLLLTVNDLEWRGALKRQADFGIWTELKRSPSL